MCVATKLSFFLKKKVLSCNFKQTKTTSNHQFDNWNLRKFRMSSNILKQNLFKKNKTVSYTLYSDVFYVFCVHLHYIVTKMWVTSKVCLVLIAVNLNIMGAYNVMDHIITVSSGRYQLLQFHIKSIEFITHPATSLCTFLAMLGIKHLFCLALFLQYLRVELGASFMLDILDKISSTGVHPNPCFYFLMMKKSIKRTSLLEQMCSDWGAQACFSSTRHPHG